MMVCTAIGKLMLHKTYTKDHPQFVFTLGDLGIGRPDVKWKKLWSRGKYGLYWRV